MLIWYSTARWAVAGRGATTGDFDCGCAAFIHCMQEQYRGRQPDKYIEGTMQRHRHSSLNSHLLDTTAIVIIIVIVEIIIIIMRYDSFVSSLFPPFFPSLSELFWRAASRPIFLFSFFFVHQHLPKAIYSLCFTEI